MLLKNIPKFPTWYSYSVVFRQRGSCRLNSYLYFSSSSGRTARITMRGVSFRKFFQKALNWFQQGDFFFGDSSQFLSVFLHCGRKIFLFGEGVQIQRQLENQRVDLTFSAIDLAMFGGFVSWVCLALFPRITPQVEKYSSAVKTAKLLS